jgi:hypothetical protein
MKGRKRTGGDASKRHRALKAKGQGRRVLRDRGGRGLKHGNAEEHNRKRWF